jgi:uncharacterized protein YbjT (DUF2867 family)
MRIAITTPTGNVGQHLVSMLVRAGVRPTLLMRDPGRLDPALRGAVDPIGVDQADGDAVVGATAGVDALYWVCPSSMAEDPVAAYTRFGEIAARAVTENSIRKVVFQSSVGAEKRRGAGEIDGLARTEQLLDSTPASVLHLRCGYFFSNLLLQLDDIKSGVMSIVLPVDHPMAWVAPRDIAEVAALRLLSDSWSGHQVQAVHGPEDLSWRQAVAIVSAAVDRDVRVEQIPDDAMREALQGIGMGKYQIDGIMGMSVGLREDFIPDQARSAQTTTPTTLGSWCYDVLRPLLSEVPHQ